MKDVAHRAGVSLKTVSRVVNDEPGVTAEVTERVRAAIRELRYEPNLSARSLRRLDRRSSTIAAIFDDLSNPHPARILRMIELAARDRGVSVLAASHEERPDRERQLVAAMWRHGVDGIVVEPAADDHHYLAELQRASVPVIFVDRPPRHLDADAVLIDNRAGARAAVEHLIAHGHRRIAFLGDLSTIATAVDRRLGYLDGLVAGGLVIDPRLAVMDVHSVGEAAERTRELLAGPHPPTAILAGQNLITIGVIYALRAAGLERSVALIGFDDFDLADLLDPPVSVISQEVEQIGALAASLLFARMDDPSLPIQTAYAPWRLVARGSGEIPAPDGR